MLDAVEVEVVRAWELLESWINAKRAANTRKFYSARLNNWCKFLGIRRGVQRDEKRLLHARLMDALRYETFLRDKKGQTSHLESADDKLATRTIAAELCALRLMYELLRREKLVTENPFERIDAKRYSKKPSKRRYELIPFYKVIELIDAPSKHTSTGRRDRAFLTLLAAGALRLSEALNLKLGDVRTTDKGTHYLVLRTPKSGSQQTQALPAWAMPNIGAFLKQREAEGARLVDFLLVSGDKRLSSNVGEAIFRRAIRSVGLDGRIYTPHCLRATAITKLLEDGNDYHTVMQFSRHSSINLVELYDRRRQEIDTSPGLSLDYRTNKKK